MLPQVSFCELGLRHTNIRGHQARERLTNDNRNHESENREAFRRDPQQIYRTGFRNSTTALFETSLKKLWSPAVLEILTEEMIATLDHGESIDDAIADRFGSPKKTQSPRTSSLPKTDTKGFVFFTIQLLMQLGVTLQSRGTAINLICDASIRNSCLIVLRPGFNV